MLVLFLNLIFQTICLMAVTINNQLLDSIWQVLSWLPFNSGILVFASWKIGITFTILSPQFHSQIFSNKFLKRLANFLNKLTKCTTVTPISVYYSRAVFKYKKKSNFICLFSIVLWCKPFDILCSFYKIYRNTKRIYECLLQAPNSWLNNQYYVTVL